MEILIFFIGFLSGVIIGVGTIIAVALKSIGNKSGKGGGIK